MSLFVAIRPSAAAVEHLDRAVAPLRSESGLRWTAPGSVHVTVAFLGAVPDENRPDLEVRLARAAARRPPMTLALAGSGHFGNRVLFAKLTGDLEALGHLAGSIAAAARRAKVPVDDRPYRAHVTLARAAGSGSLRSLAERLGGYAGPAWTVEEVLLMESRPASGPGRPSAYTVVSRHPLAGGPG
jgi:2'-5' RNA ligase